MQLTEEQAKVLRRLAHAQRVSLAELVRRGVDLMLRSGGVGSTDELRARAAAVSGRFHSGHSDLSTAHDNHLPGAYAR